MSHELLWITERFGAKVMDQWLVPLSFKRFSSRLLFRLLLLYECSLCQKVMKKVLHQ